MIILMLVLLGLCAGSFVNALVWRLHEQSKSKKSKAKAYKTANLSVWRGRSMCPNCQHRLDAMDLVPVFSWLWLRGKCRYCHQSISAQYPLVELLTALLFVASYVYWPLAFDSRGITLFVFWLIFLVAFMALTLYDLRWFLLPDKIIKPMIGLALVQSVVMLFMANSPTHLLFGLLFNAVIGGGIFYIIFQISQGKWIGGGDVKLGFLLGLVLADGGLMVLTIFLASILGSLISIPLILRGKTVRNTKIPFGPFLIAGAIIARLFGASIIHWYRTKLLLSS